MDQLVACSSPFLSGWEIPAEIHHGVRKLTPKWWDWLAACLPCSPRLPPLYLHVYFMISIFNAPALLKMLNALEWNIFFQVVNADGGKGNKSTNNWNLIFCSPGQELTLPLLPSILQLQRQNMVTRTGPANPGTHSLNTSWYKDRIQRVIDLRQVT